MKRILLNSLKSLVWVLVCLFLLCLALIAFDNAPYGKDWVDVMGALLTPVIGGAAIFISLLQYKIKKQENEHFFFKEKWRAFLALDRRISEKVEEKSASHDLPMFAKIEYHELQDEIDYCSIFYGEDVKRHISKIVLEANQLTKEDLSVKWTGARNRLRMLCMNSIKGRIK